MRTGPPSERAYRRLLGLLPRALRDEAADELVQTFRQAHHRVARRGRLVRAWFWARMTADIAAAAWAERRARARRPRRSIPMSLAQAIGHVLMDIPLAFRRLARTPGLTLLSSGTLALGLAAAVLALVLVRDVLLRPLGFPAPDRLVRIVEVSANGRTWWPSFPNAADWREHGRLFSGVAIADIPRIVPVLLGGHAARVPVSRAARGFFETLGVTPAAGRLFLDEEYRPGSAPAALVSEAFWRRELGSRALTDVALVVGTERYAVVGVVPAGFRFLGDGAAWTEPADVWTPMDRDTNLGSRTTHGIHVVGRLRDGLTLDRARSEMNELAARLKAAHGQPTQADTARLTLLHDVVLRNVREPLQLLLSAAFAVLLVACFNLAATILAQGLHRSRELSVRLALGASRWTLARHLLVEATALAVPAATLGVLLAVWALRIVQAAAPGTLPRLDEAAVDPVAVGLAFALAMATAGLAGVTPALVLSRATLVQRLRTHGAVSDARGHARLWKGFVAAQVALTALLLIASGLLVRSFSAALSVDVGYDARQVLAVDVALPELGYAEPARRLAFYDEALRRLRATPGIRHAGLTSALPHVTSIYTGGTSREGEGPKTLMAAYRLVDPGYFDAVGITRVLGDDRSLDGDGALIDRRLADSLWAGASPIGDRVIASFANRALTVSGLVGTVREWHQGDETIGVVYADYRRQPERTQAMHLVVRYDGDPARAARTVRDVIAAVDGMVPVSIAPLDALASESLRPRRLQLLMAAGFGIIALGLAAAGVYALVTFVAARQRREYAIRLALGARPTALQRRVIVQGLIPPAIGLALAMALAVPLGRAIRAQLFQVQPVDPVVLAGAVSAIVLSVILASLLPARRTARQDPAGVLRQD